MPDLMLKELNEYGLWTVETEGYIPANIDLERILAVESLGVGNVIEYEVRREDDYILYISLSKYVKIGKKIKDDYDPVNKNNFYRGAFMFCIGKEREIARKILLDTINLISFAKRITLYNKQQLEASDYMARMHLLIYYQEKNLYYNSN